MPETTTKEKPLNLTADEARALADGRKMMHWLPVKVQPSQDGKIHGSEAWYWPHTGLDAGYCHTNADALSRLMVQHAPYSIGDSIYVREPHIIGWPVVGGELQDCDEDGNDMPKHAWYAADDNAKGWVSDKGAMIHGWTDDSGYLRDRVPWKSSTQMPSWASRFHLEVTAVRVGRLNDVTEEEASKCGWGGLLRLHFHSDWDRRWKKRGYGRETNPWCWIIEWKPA